VGLLALLHSLQHIYLYALPPLYLILRSEFNVSTFQIGLLGSVYGVISIFQGPAGYLVERFGGKRLAVLSMLGWRSTLQLIPVVGLCIIFLFWKFVNEEPFVVQQSISASTDPIQSERTEFRFTLPLFILILSISILSLGNIQNFIPLFLTEAYGENVVWAGILTGVMIAIGSTVSLLGGALSDKYDKTLIMMSANLGLAITMILLAIGQFSSAVLLLVLILYGVARYLPVPAQHALSSITAAEHPQGIGFSYTGIALGQVVSAPLIGYLIDLFGVRTTFLVCSVFPLISIIILIVFRKYFVNGLEVSSS